MFHWSFNSFEEVSIVQVRKSSSSKRKSRSGARRLSDGKSWTNEESVLSFNSSRDSSGVSGMFRFQDSSEIFVWFCVVSIFAILAFDSFKRFL